MQLQTMIVALIVIGCALHATWRLMPASLRRSLSARLLRGEMPAASGCGGGCDGCGDHAKTTARAPGAAQPIAFHPRMRR